MVFDQEQDSWPVPGLGPSSIGPDASAKQVHVNTVQINSLQMTNRHERKQFCRKQISGLQFHGKICGPCNISVSFKDWEPLAKWLVK